MNFRKVKRSIVFIVGINSIYQSTRLNPDEAPACRQIDSKLRIQNLQQLNND